MKSDSPEGRYTEKEERETREWPPGINWAKKVEKPWGYELVWARTPLYGGKVLHIEAGRRLSLQYHRVKDETIYVASGKILLQIDGEDGVLLSLEMTPGSSHRVLPGRRHRFQALETADVLEVSTPQYEDVVRIEDDYQRAGDAQ
jgi:mannose-6-phosphate isomerase